MNDERRTTNDERRELALDFTVLNTQVRPREHLRASLKADLAAIAAPGIALP